MPSSSSNGNGTRTVRLKLPWTGKVVSLAIWEEERVDLGSISRAFGVDPSTVRLNGYFLSRGVDLVSCSVTWRSLIGFFASKGLSTGEDDDFNGPLVVDGKLSKVGTKRGHDPVDADSRVRVREAGHGCGGEYGIPQARDTCLLANKRLKDNKSVSEEGHRLYKWSGIGSKRKQSLEDISLLKKLKINENKNSGGDDRPGVACSKQITCSLTSGNMKRTIGDELLLAPPCKRIRYKI